MPFCLITPATTEGATVGYPSSSSFFEGFTPQTPRLGVVGDALTKALAVLGSWAGIAPCPSKTQP